MLVGRRAVAAQDDHVVEFGIGDAHGPLHEVLDLGHALPRGAEADGGLHSRRCLTRVPVTPTAVIARRLPGGDGLGPHLVQLLLRAVAAIGAALLQHGQRHLSVASLARSLKNRRRVRVEAEPVETVDDDLGRRVGAAGAVGIFDPQQELAAVMAGEEVVEQRGAGAADVQESSGTRSETGSDRAHGGCLEHFRGE